MQPQLIKTEQAEFVPGKWLGKNTAGIEPLDDAVLVLPDKAAEKTTGGVHLPETQTSRQSLASETGLVFAIGDGAFVWNLDRTRPFAGKRPEPGTRVTFQRYAGQIVIGRDGQQFRLMSDSAIRGVEVA